MTKRNVGVSPSRILLRVALAAGAAALVVGPSYGANLVQNPGFETGDLTDWTPVGNFSTGFNHVTTDIAFKGAYSLADGNVADQGTAGASQQLATVSGAGYLVSVEWLANGANDAANQLFQVLWDGNVVAYTQGAAAWWTMLSGTVTGTGSDTLIVQGYSTSGYNYVDNISVTETIPEPATWALTLAGFAGIGFMGLRRAGGRRPAGRERPRGRT